MKSIKGGAENYGDTALLETIKGVKSTPGVRYGSMGTQHFVDVRLRLAAHSSVFGNAERLKSTPRLARIEVFASDEVAIVHVMNRVVRRCFLLGDDAITVKNNGHRKQWLDDQLDSKVRSPAFRRNVFHRA